MARRRAGAPVVSPPSGESGGGGDSRECRIDVVGMGPAGPELMTAGARSLIAGARSLTLRTNRHPAAAAFPGAASFDHLYESGATFEQVYEAIVSELVDAARRCGPVVYAVPGSPSVAERTVGLLLGDPAVRSREVELVVHPAMSFLDLAFARLQVDPIVSGVRVVDGESFAIDAAGERGPLLVAQCWSSAVLSQVKLAAESPSGAAVTVLYHLGLPDERVWEVEWDDLDRSFEPDHLTSLWIPVMAAPVAFELVRLEELTRTLRQRCPWDRRQTHGSLARHLMEECYEALEAIDGVAAIDEALDDCRKAPGLSVEERNVGLEGQAIADLEEELGDLLFQVYLHSVLAAEAGRFNLADVARGIYDKLVSRHPHLFDVSGIPLPLPDGEAADQMAADQMAIDWEERKKVEKHRASVTEGIPSALPALALAAKLQRKALAVGMVLPGQLQEAAAAAEGLASLVPAGTAAVEDCQPAAGSPTSSQDHADQIGALLFSVVNLARMLGVDPEGALRVRAAGFRSSVEALG